MLLSVALAIINDRLEQPPVRERAIVGLVCDYGAGARVLVQLGRFLSLLLDVLVVFVEGPHAVQEYPYLP